jgi:hypothetical protein
VWIKKKRLEYTENAFYNFASKRVSNAELLTFYFCNYHHAPTLQNMRTVAAYGLCVCARRALKHLEFSLSAVCVYLHIATRRSVRGACDLAIKHADLTVILSEL